MVGTLVRAEPTHSDGRPRSRRRRPRRLRGPGRLRNLAADPLRRQQGTDEPGRPAGERVDLQLGRPRAGPRSLGDLPRQHVLPRALHPGLRREHARALAPVRSAVLADGKRAAARQRGHPGRLHRQRLRHLPAGPGAGRHPPGGVSGWRRVRLRPLPGGPARPSPHPRRPSGALRAPRAAPTGPRRSTPPPRRGSRPPGRRPVLVVAVRWVDRPVWGGGLGRVAAAPPGPGCPPGPVPRRSRSGRRSHPGGAGRLRLPGGPPPPSGVRPPRGGALCRVGHARLLPRPGLRRRRAHRRVLPLARPSLQPTARGRKGALPRLVVDGGCRRVRCRRRLVAPPPACAAAKVERGFHAGSHPPAWWPSSASVGSP